MQILLHSAHAAVNAHVVVVKDNEQVVGHGAGIVYAFKCQRLRQRYKRFRYNKAFRAKYPL